MVLTFVKERLRVIGTVGAVLVFVPILASCGKTTASTSRSHRSETSPTASPPAASPPTSKPPAASPPTTSPAASSSSRHVMVLMMENQSYSGVIGSSSAPFETSLSKTYEAVTSSYGIGHYSLDNYLGLLSGQFFSWSTGDCSPGPGCQSNAPTFVGQLGSSHVSWNAFMGGMPADCDRSNVSTYAVRHDPFVYFPAIVTKDCSKIQPLSGLLAALDRSSPPSFVFVSPSLCQDGGGDISCSTLPAGDAFLAREIPAIEQTPWYRSGGVIILTYDEGNGPGQGEQLTGAGNHIPTIVVSRATEGASPETSYVNYFGVLAGLEKVYGEPCLAQACSPSNGLLPIP